MGDKQTKMTEDSIYDCQDCEGITERPDERRCLDCWKNRVTEAPFEKKMELLDHRIGLRGHAKRGDTLKRPEKDEPFYLFEQSGELWSQEQEDAIRKLQEVPEISVADTKKPHLMKEEHFGQGIYIEFNKEELIAKQL